MVSSLHVFDFDGTIFASPVINTTLWTRNVIGKLRNELAFYHHSATVG